MRDLAIRRATAADCPVLAELLVEAFDFYGEHPPGPTVEIAEKLRTHLDRHPGFEALLAANRRGPVGFAFYSAVFWTADCGLALFLKELFIRDTARRQGAGKAVMQALAQVAEERGWRRMVWTVDTANWRARRFYDGLPGAVEAGKLVYVIPTETLLAEG